MKRANFGISGIVTSALLAAAPLSVANAADMAVKAPPPMVAATPIYDWTSCYLGGNVGGLWAHKDWNDVTPGLVGFSGGHDVDGVIGGLQVGCDYQLPSRFVIGLQASDGFTNAKGSNVNLLAPGISDQTQIDNLATLTARLGFAIDRFLPYIRGGAAWEHDHYNLNVIALNAPFSSASETRSGYTVGVGLEYAFSNCLTGFAEYDYYGFGSRTLTFPSAATDYYSIKESKSVALVGLNLRLGKNACGMTPAPVVTKG